MVALFFNRVTHLKVNVMSNDEHLYTKRPVCIRAIQLNNSNIEVIKEHFDDLPVIVRNIQMENPSSEYVAERCGDQSPFVNWDIITQEGVMTARHGDYIICGVHGEYYPCAPDIFRATYRQGDHSV